LSASQVSAFFSIDLSPEFGDFALKASQLQPQQPITLGAQPGGFILTDAPAFLAIPKRGRPSVAEVQHASRA
jgi:hypothetical protein